MAVTSPFREKVNKDGVYSVRLVPWNRDAPTYVYGVFGKREANVGNYVTGNAVQKIAKAFNGSRYNQHYRMEVKAVNTQRIGGKTIADVAKANDKDLRNIYNSAMKQLSTFYQHSPTTDYGSEWQYQPKGGTSSNSL